ncbi:MAG: tetratricopeptide repeat protein, partial [Hyphomicrobiales bacterium]|nr:tetratricopeptide repeat protein [Hyphomicrobiales bacterium]MBV8662769.1 tetratricopeptide repeat protein [Hyphomicrobiales bacterium]
MNISAPVETAERIDAAAQLVVAGRHGDAETLLRAILEAEPGNADAINTLASIALARRDGQRAYDILAPACSAYADHPRLMANLGLAYSMLNKPHEAVACLDRAVALAPHDAELRLALAQFLANAGDVARAAHEIETVLRQDPDNVSALARLGVVKMASGDLAGAEDAWRRLLAREPKNADALYNLSVLVASTGRPAEAARLAERAHLWAPLDLTKRLQFARCLANIGEFERAKTQCTQILMVAPEHLQATELFARLTLIRGAVPAGLETLSHLVRKNPKNPDAILALAGALRFVGRMPQALAFVDQALTLAPDHAFGQRLRADLLLTLGRFREAWPPSAVLPADAPGRVFVPQATSTIDALVFGRFLAAPYADGGALISQAQAMATGLMRHIRGVRLADSAEPDAPPALPLHGLLAARGVERDNLAPAERFLDPDPAQVERWRNALMGLPRPLIGIDWDEFAPGARVDAVLPLAAKHGTVVSFAADP